MALSPPEEIWEHIAVDLFGFKAKHYLNIVDLHLIRWSLETTVNHMVWEPTWAGAFSASNKTSFCHRISVEEAPLMTPKDALSLLESDFKDTDNSDQNVSQDDLQFLETLGKNIHINENGNSNVSSIQKTTLTPKQQLHSSNSTPPP